MQTGAAQAAGLRNLGRTCYFSAALQCLVFVPPLANYFLLGLEAENLHKKRVNACAFTQAFAALVCEYWEEGEATVKGPRVLDPTPLKVPFNKLYKAFNNSNPHDAHEALLAALKTLHDSLTRTKPIQESKAAAKLTADDLTAWHTNNSNNYSFVTEVFQGQSVSSLTSDEHGPIGVTHEHWLDLALSIDGASSVQQALAAYLAPETVQGYQHAQHGTIAVQKTVRITYAPLTLVLHLKRFEHRRGRAGNPKVDKFVDYGFDLSVQESGRSVGYRLYAVVLHSGGASDGHYTALCHSRGTWWLLDDEAVTEVTDLNLLIRREAYILFYKRINS